MAKIEDALPFVLKNEGGFVNDPADPGGATNFGITLRVLSDWRGKRVSVADVRNMTVVEACAIYKAHYWDLLHLDNVRDQGVATALFDVCVNRGPGVAKQYENEILSRLGRLDINLCDPIAFIKAFEQRVEAGYIAIANARPSSRKFLAGWMARAKRLLGLK